MAQKAEKGAEERKAENRGARRRVIDQKRKRTDAQRTCTSNTGLKRKGSQEVTTGAVRRGHGEDRTKTTILREIRKGKTRKLGQEREGGRLGKKEGGNDGSTRRFTGSGSGRGTNQRRGRKEEN